MMVVQFSAQAKGLIPSDIVVAVLDIQTSKVYNDILVNPYHY